MRIAKKWRVLLLILIDTVFIKLAYTPALYYRYSFDIPMKYLNNYIKNIVVMVIGAGAAGALILKEMSWNSESFIVC